MCSVSVHGCHAGLFFGSFVHGAFPQITAMPGAYALVAMGGLVAGTTRAPITAIIIVFELTSDYNIILPLMITCIISAILSSKLSRESIYTLKLMFRNINLKEGTELNVMKSLFVRDVFTREYESILENKKFSEVVNEVISHKVPYFAVENEKKELVGMISIHDKKTTLGTKKNWLDNPSEISILGRNMMWKFFLSNSTPKKERSQNHFLALIMSCMLRTGLSWRGKTRE